MTEEEGFVFRDKRRSASGDESSEELKGEKPADKLPDRAETETPPATTGSDESKKTDPPPKINFATFILSLSSSAAMSLGGYQDPVSGHVPKNLELARQTIDILGIMEEKTKGNLSEEEGRLLSVTLYELRMRYVDAVKSPEKPDEKDTRIIS